VSPSALPAGHRSLPIEATRFMQRARILDATALMVAERGYAGASINAIRSRAGVSARTFYEHFDRKEEVALAAFDAAAGYTVPRIVNAFRSHEDWAGGVDVALGTYLAILDCDRAWAVLCLVELPVIGTDAAVRRRASLAPLITALRAAPAADCPVAIPVVLAAVDGILRDRLLREDGGGLQDLRDELVGLVLSVCLGRQRARQWISGRVAEPVAPARLGRAARAADIVARLDDRQTSAELEAVVDEAVAARDGAALWRIVVGLHGRRLRHEPVPWALERRVLEGLREAWFFGMPVRDMQGSGWGVPTPAARTLAYIGEHPGATSQEVRRALGFSDLSQVSRLLARLQREGLLVRGAPRGRANAWLLTDSGDNVVRAQKGQ
jgi:AcrR family transcriptional regulator